MKRIFYLPQSMQREREGNMAFKVPKVFSVLSVTWWLKAFPACPA